jgi:apolipoprotein N-acyltransferase
MQSTFWKQGTWKLWAAAVLSAGLLELPFPLAGPMPVWRSVFAWFGLVPLLWALLSPACAAAPRPLRRGFLIGYLCGVLWYMGNCYWVRDTMLRYGDMPPMAPTLLLIGYSMVLGLYFGLFGWGVALVRRATGSTRLALAFAPVLWAALELAASRITSVPWDQLGYSQVDNALVNQLAPWTGVYGISFVLVGVNALLTGGLVLESRPHIGHRDRIILRATGVLLMMAGAVGVSIPPPQPASTATAVLIQPNLDVAGENCMVWPRRVGAAHRRVQALGRRTMQNLHRRNPANRRAYRRNHLPALPHASRSGRLAGVARALHREERALSSRR